MQGKSLTDFLQVSINTEKFNHFATCLSNALATHDKQLQQHTRELAQMRLTMEDRLTRITHELQFEKQRFDKKRKEDSDFFQSFMNDVRKKHDGLTAQARKRLTQVEQSLKKQEARVGDEFAFSLKQEIKDSILEQMNLLEEEVTTIDAQVKNLESQFKKNISTQDFILKNVLDAYEGKSKGYERGENNPSNFKPSHSKRQTRRESYFSREDKEKTYPLEQATIREGRERRRRKAQQKCQQQNLQYASISAKIDSLQTRLTAKENQSINKVLYANGNKGNNLNSEASQQVIPFSMDRIELERKNLEQNITSKLEHIEEIIGQKFSKSEKEAIKLKNKYDLLEDQYEIIQRKFEKEKSKIADLAFQIKKFEDKKIDDKLVDNLVLMMKRQTNSLEAQVESKVNTEVWEKQKARVHQRLQILTQSLSLKADKDQIKRAFQFIEDKIKEIVLLMADDAHQEKEGAGRKLPFKSRQFHTQYLSTKHYFRSFSMQQFKSTPSSSSRTVRLKMIREEQKYFILN